MPIYNPSASSSSVAASNITGTLSVAQGGTNASNSADVLTNLGLAATTYTPTLTNIANITGSTAYLSQYMRLGNTVTVSGVVDIDPTLAVTSTQLGISLPIASSITSRIQIAGTANCPSIANQSAAILGDATNDRAQMEWISGDITSQPMYFTFTYIVL